MRRDNLSKKREREEREGRGGFGGRQSGEGNCGGPGRQRGDDVGEAQLGDKRKHVALAGLRVTAVRGIGRQEECRHSSCGASVVAPMEDRAR